MKKTEGFMLVNWDDWALDIPVRFYASWEAVIAYHIEKNFPPPRHPDIPAEPWKGYGHRPTSGYKYVKIEILDVPDPISE